MNVNASELSAKLLATENIAVIRARVRTASFDIKNRVLTLPQWKEMSPAVEGMLIGHEVGHALYTSDDYIDPIKQEHRLQGYMNILEDVRIEKLIKRKYPGIRKTMNEGYKQLNDQDFFGVSKIQDFSTLSLIDRINLYFKVGFQCGVKFTPEEKVYVNQAEKTETVEDVIKLAQEIYEYAKKDALEKKKQSLQQNPSDMQELEEEEDDLDDFDASMEYNEDEFGEDSDEEFDHKPKVSDYQAGKSSIDPKTIEEKVEQQVEEEIKAKTVDAFEQKLQELADDSTEYRYYVLDERDPIINPVVGFKTILEETAEIDEELSTLEKENVDKFKIDSGRVVNYLIKEFEMRKSATLYKRAQTSKIGSLDMSKVWSYKLNDDLFKRVTVLPKGKNHGMIMLVDWSGSMDGVLDDTVKQVINLAMFCQRAQIPYRVFAFTTQYNLFKGEYDAGAWHAKKEEFMSRDNVLGNAVNPHFALLEFFSSKMTTSEFNTMIRRVWNHYHLARVSNGGYGTGGTPLNEALSFMLNYIPKFAKANNVEKMSFITLTDGEGGSLPTSKGRYLEDRQYDYATGKNIKIKNFLKDATTKKDYVVDRNGSSQTEAILRMMKDRYNINSVGFYICRNARRDLGDAIRNNLPGFNGNFDSTIEAMRKSFRDEGFASISNTGRDDLFIVPQSKLVVEEGELTVEETQTARQIARMFSKQMGGRRTSRVLLNRFIGYIA